jgi:hypothetical protein
MEFYDVMSKGGFDVIIGNPPYVEISKIRDYTIGAFSSRDCGNLFAPVTELAVHLCAKQSGYLGLIVPLSIFATKRMLPLGSILNTGKELLALSHFDVYPAKLFDGAKQRLTILIRSERTVGKFVTTCYQRWFNLARSHLFQTLAYGAAVYHKSHGNLEKASNPIHSNVLQKLHKLRDFSSGCIIQSRSNPKFFVHRIPYNYVKALTFIPYFWSESEGEKKSEDYKPYAAILPKLDGAAVAVLNSNLFFMWWHSMFEGYHCGKHEITSFPLSASLLNDELAVKLAHLSTKLMEDLEANKNRKQARYEKTGMVVYDEFFPRKSKAVIDLIDIELQKVFSLSDDEVDFIINYDIKFRVNDISTDTVDD